MALSGVPSKICLDFGSGQPGDWMCGEEFGRVFREETGRAGQGSRCRKKRRTSGMIIWMGYSEDRSGSHDFSGGGRRSCQDLIWGRAR